VAKLRTAPVATTRARNAAEWRRWLTKNHKTSEAVLLVYAKKNSEEASIDWQESVDEALCFGWVDGVRSAVDATHFAVRFTPRKKTSIWSKRNLERIAELQKTGRMKPAGLQAFEHGKSRGQHEKAYAISDEVSMPPELEQALAKNARGRKAFAALTPGQKKAWQRHVLWVKGAEARKTRAQAVPLLILAGRKAGETDNQAARRGVASKAEILAAAAKGAR
jgi:uncharacterized protein YdeI (YjbR/CyaY-like superfamily)